MKTCKWLINLSPEFSSVPESCLTLCDPVDCSTPGFPVHHQLPELTQLMSIESVMPSKHLIRCHPLFHIVEVNFRFNFLHMMFNCTSTTYGKSFASLNHPVIFVENHLTTDMWVPFCACNVGDRFYPWVVTSPGVGNGNLLHYSCLKNLMDRGARQATVHGVPRVGHNLVTKPPPP